MTSMTRKLAPAPNKSGPNHLVAGIDTHKHTHHVAIIDHLGRPITDRQFDTTPAGYNEIVNYLHTAGTISAVGVEGTGSYGAGISRVLVTAGFEVFEVARPNRRSRRLRGKSDPLDAQQAALSALSDTDTALPKAGDGVVEALRMLLTERNSASKARSQTMNQVHAMLVTAPDSVRDDYRALGSAALITVLSRTRPGSGADPTHTARRVLKRLARRHVALTEEIALIEQEMEPLIRSVNPALFSLSGVGVVTASTLLVAAGDNPERLGTMASFASLAGVAPIPASSGQRTRHRLSRGGNRQANHALHRIVLLRMRHKEPRTAAYFERRRAEGLSDRDIMRCLKRHIANEVYKALMSPSLDSPVGRELRITREEAGIPITVLADTLGVPYQRLRRLEIGTRADAELEDHARAALALLKPPSTA